MHTLWTIEALIEAISHPQQLSPTLARNYHPIEPIKHHYRIERNRIHIPLSDGTSRWLLTMPTKGTFGVAEHEIRAKCLIAQNSPMLAEAYYIRSAVTLFTCGGTPHTLPALLQRHGEPLEQFIRLHISAKHRPHLRRALESIALSADRLTREGLGHHTISRQSICFDEECRLHLLDYPIATNTTNHTLQLCEAALLLYIAGCQADAYQFLNQKSKTTEECQRRLRALLAAGEFYAIRPLVRMVESILHKGSVGDMIALLSDLAAEPFRPMPLLTGLLTGSSPQPTPTHSNGEQPPMVDFRHCDEVLPAGEGLVRYRLRGLWGYAHTNGTRLPVERILLYAEEFFDGKAVVKTPRGYGLMNTEGRMIMNDVWEDMCWHHEEGIVTAADCDGKWRIYDSLGRQLSSVACDWMGSVAEGYIVGRQGNKFGYFSTSGQKLTNFIYDEAYSFRNGLALVRFKGSLYHIDTTFHRIGNHEEEFILRYRGMKVGK